MAEAVDSAHSFLLSEGLTWSGLPIRKVMLSYGLKTAAGRPCVESREVERKLYLVAVGFESREQMWGPL